MEIDLKTKNVKPPNIKRDIEITPGMFFLVMLALFIISVATSVAFSGIFFNTDEYQCSPCGNNICECGNFTLPENMCDGVIVNYTDNSNNTFKYTVPTCILSGCSDSKIIESCISKNINIRITVKEGNTTILNDVLMPYYGDGEYVQSSGGIDYKITIGD